MGHFLGLGEDRSNAAATMFFCTNPCETHKRDLATDDRTAILDSYSQADFSPNLAPACQMARRPAGDLPLTVWITLGFSAAALAARRRA
ncbi:MAG TPA: hypothetical protein VGJ84_20395 [Polyangiaceae bacterium]